MQATGVMESSAACARKYTRREKRLILQFFWLCAMVSIIGRTFQIYFKILKTSPSILEPQSVSIVPSMMHLPLDAMTIVAQDDPWQLSGVRSDAIAGDFTLNATARETSRCWRRLARSLGRRPHLAVVGDSRGRILYHHLRRRWRLQPELVNGTECLAHFVYKNRTDWCHYHASSPLVDVRFYWSRHADADLLTVLETVSAGCRARTDSCPHLLVLTIGTHVMGSLSAPPSQLLLAAGAGIEQVAEALDRLAGLGVRVFWKLNEAENYESVRTFAAPVNDVHAIYNAMVADRVGQVAPSVRFWSSVLPPSNNYIARCRLDRRWLERREAKPDWNCNDHLHFGDVVQEQYRNMLQRYLCRQM